jgi:hypothetical protein
MVAVVPQSPLMVPQLTAGRAADSEPMRSACLDVAARLAAASDRWLVVAADPGGRRTVDQPIGGTFLGFGVDVPVTLTPGSPGAGAGAADPALPLPLLVAGWLRGRAAPGLRAVAELVPPDLGTEECRRLGAGLAARVEPDGARVGLLVVGDGAITHTAKAPGHSEERAGRFDAAVATALAGADPAGLLALDPLVAAELGAVGRAPWQVLAGAAEHGPDRWTGELVYTGAPFGVGYHVALWRR